MFEPTDSTDIYHLKRDSFWRYVVDEVNPSRKAHGLEEINREIGCRCFDIIYDFERQNHERREAKKKAEGLT